MMTDEIAQRLMPLLVRRTWRRGLVSVASLGYGTRMSALASGAVPLAFAALVIAGTSGVGLLLATRKVAEGLDGLLDECERAVRAVAHRIAFRIIGYARLAADTRALWLPRAPGEVTLALLLVCLPVYLLPTAIVAWAEPEAAAEG